MLKKRYLVILSLLILIGSVTAVSAADNVINVKSQEPFTYQLDSNPSTGYYWVAVCDCNTLDILSQEFIPSSNSTMPGQSGMDVFTMKTWGPASFTIHFYKYSPSNEIVETVNLEVNSE